MFIFILLCGASKGFMKAFKGFHSLQVNAFLKYNDDLKYSKFHIFGVKAVGYRYPFSGIKPFNPNDALKLKFVIC